MNATGIPTCSNCGADIHTKHYGEAECRGCQRQEARVKAHVPSCQFRKRIVATGSANVFLCTCSR